MKYQPVFVFFLIVFTGLGAIAQTVRPDSNFHIYLLMGQSNMAGRGPLTEKYRAESDDRVFVLNQQKQWVIARHPLHFDKPTVDGVGPGLAFGVEMARYDKGVKIGLVPCAVGGSPIEHWVPGAYDAATKTHPYDDAVARIKEAEKYGVIKGVIWHQGESNSKSSQTVIYLAQLNDLIARIRALTGYPQLPFIAGQLGSFYKEQADFNRMVKQLPKQIPHTAVVISRGLIHKGDTLHFDSSSAEKLGRRYATAMHKLAKER